MGTPALASDRVERQRMRLFELEQGLRVRSASHDVERGRDRMHSALDPVACAVLSAERRGGGGMPCELRLDRSYRDLAGCADVVTCGDALLGFLAQPGIGAAIADTPMDPARVLLLNDDAAPEPGCVEALTAAWGPGDGALGPVLIDAAGQIESAGLRLGRLGRVRARRRPPAGPGARAGGGGRDHSTRIGEPDNMCAPCAPRASRISPNEVHTISRTCPPLELNHDAHQSISKFPCRT
jgi:hypothetical protein